MLKHQRPLRPYEINDNRHQMQFLNDDKTPPAPTGGQPPLPPTAPPASYPVPPEPVKFAGMPEDFKSMMMEQYTQATRFKSEFDKIQQESSARIAELERKIAENEGKVASYDKLNESHGAQNEYMKGILKSKYESLPKDLIEARSLKMEDLEKNPLQSIKLLETELKMYNNILEIAKKQLGAPPDGTDGAPGTGAPGAPKPLKTRADVKNEIDKVLKGSK